MGWVAERLGADPGAGRDESTARHRRCHLATDAEAVRCQPSRHRTAQADFTKMDFHSADGTYEMLRDCFMTIAEMFGDADFSMEPIPLK